MRTTMNVAFYCRNSKKALGHTEIKTTQRYYAELQTDTILNEISNGLKSH